MSAGKNPGFFLLIEAFSWCIQGGLCIQHWHITMVLEVFTSLFLLLIFIVLSAGCLLDSVTDDWNPLTLYIPHAFQMRTYIDLLIPKSHFFGIVGEEALRNTWTLPFYSHPSLWKSLERILHSAGSSASPERDLEAAELVLNRKWPIPTLLLTKGGRALLLPISAVSSHYSRRIISNHLHRPLYHKGLRAVGLGTELKIKSLTRLKLIGQ